MIHPITHPHRLGAVIQLPPAIFRRAPPIAVLASEVDSRASISMRKATNRRFHTLQRRAIGDAQDLPHIAVLSPFRIERGFDLRPCSVHQHHLRAEAAQQRDIPDEIIEVGARSRFATESDDEGAAVVRVRVRCGGTQRGNEFGGVHRRIIVGGRGAAARLRELSAV